MLTSEKEEKKRSFLIILTKSFPEKLVLRLTDDHRYGVVVSSTDDVQRLLRKESLLPEVRLDYNVPH